MYESLIKSESDYIMAIAGTSVDKSSGSWHTMGNDRLTCAVDSPFIRSYHAVTTTYTNHGNLFGKDHRNYDTEIGTAHIVGLERNDLH